MERVLLLVTIAVASLIPQCRGNISLVDSFGRFSSEHTFFKNLVPRLTFFGLQKLNITVQKAYRASDSDMLAFCNLHDLGDVSSVFDFKEPTALFIRETVENDYTNCNYEIGKKTFGPEGLSYWCTIRNAIIVFVSDQGGIYPGLYGNDYAARSEYIYNSNYNATCRYFETRIETSIELDFIESIGENTSLYITSNSSDMERMNRHWLVQIWFRVIIAGSYLFLAIQGCRFFYARLRMNSLNHTQAKVLIINIVVCFTFFVLEVLGNKGLTTNLSR